MKLTVNYETNEILIGDKPLGVSLSDAKLDLVFGSDAGQGVARVFIGFDEVVTIPRKPVDPPRPEPDLMDEISAGDAFEVEMERIRRGARNG